MLWEQQHTRVKMAADTKLCTLVEEGALRINGSVESIVYHKGLNVLLSFTGGKNVSIFDVSSGNLLYSTSLVPLDGRHSPGASFSVNMERRRLMSLSIPERGNIVLCFENMITARKEYCRLLLLESAFQESISQEDETVLLELPHTEAMSLRDLLQTMDLSNAEPEFSSQHTSVMNMLALLIKRQAVNSSKGQRPWSIARIELPWNVLKSVCSQAIAEMKNHSNAALSVAATTVVRLLAMAKKSGKTGIAANEETTTTANNNNTPVNPWNSSSNNNNPNPLMSEAVRRETFGTWPHMNYKWALPHQMAEAGFYHQPNTPQSDRAVCFLCNLCLICWEPSDEPWSEHERHAPTCPLVKGDYTVNVPIGVTMATQPPLSHGDCGEWISCISTTTNPDLIATGVESGTVVLWNAGGPLKKEISFSINDSASRASFSVGSLFIAANSESKSLTSNPYSYHSTLFVGGAMDGKPSIIIYDVRRIPSCEGSSKPSSVMGGKGGATKEVVSHPHPPLPVHHMAGGGKENLYFSFCDDPLVEEIYIAGDGETGTKLGKYSQLPSGLFVNPVLMPPSGFDKSTPSAKAMAAAAALAKADAAVVDAAAESAVAAASKIIKPLPTVTAIEPKVRKIGLVDLTSFGVDQGLSVVSMTPTLDGECVLAVIAAIGENLSGSPKKDFVLSPIIGGGESTKHGNLTNDEKKEAALRSIWGNDSTSAYDMTSKSYLVLFRLEASRGGAVTLSDPITVTEISSKETPVSVTMIPQAESDDSEGSFSRSYSRRFAAVASQDGNLRLLDINDRLTWVGDYDSSQGKFVCTEYCSGVDRLVAGTDSGGLVFFRVNRPGSDAEKRKRNKGKTPLKLIAQQPIERDVVLHALHDLFQTEDLTQNCVPVINAPPCWTEMPPTQRQRRHPQSWLLQQGPATGDDSLQLTKIFKLQQDRDSWDEHLFEINLPQSLSLAHVNLKFVLASGCSTPPNIQVSLLQQNNRNFRWDKTKDAEEVDMAVNFNLNEAAAETHCSVNPVLSETFLEAHDAVLLCGPVSLPCFIDSTSQSGVINLSSIQLLSFTGKGLLLHLKYMASAEPVAGLLDARRSRPDLLSHKTSQTLRGCDFIREIAITLSKHRTTLLTQERLQRGAMLTSADFTGKLVDFVCKNKTFHRTLRALEIINWKNAVLAGNSRAESSRVVAEHVEQVKVRLHGLLENCFISGCRYVSQQAAQALISTYDVALRCLDEQQVSSFTEDLLSCSVNCLPSLIRCSNPTAVHWYLVLLSRVSSLNSTAVASAAQALVSQLSKELAKRKEPLNQLLQTRFGLSGRPFEEDIFNIEPVVTTVAAKPSLLPYNNLLNAGDQEKTTGLDAMLLGKPSDLGGVEPLTFSIHSASDGIRLERTDGGNPQFTVAALNGLAETSKTAANLEASSEKPHRWQHLFIAPQPSPNVVMDRLHSGTRKFITLDFGSPVLLTDLFVPACPEWAGIIVDTWNDDNSQTDVEIVRLATSSAISRTPLILRLIQPPLLCRFLKITVVGRQGSTTSSCRTPIGCFFGHTVILPTDGVKSDCQSEATREEIKEHVTTLEVVADHVRCHYGLACDRLRRLLIPLLMKTGCLVGSAVTDHVDHFLRNQLGTSGGTSASEVATEEDRKIFSAYEECVRLQYQLSLLRGTRKRLSRYLLQSTTDDDKNDEESVACFDTCSSHKLEYIAHGLVNLMLPLVAEERLLLPKTEAVEVFQNLFISSSPASQLTCAALLTHTCSYQPWWPSFLAEVLFETMSSTVEASLYPKDRIFLAFLYMANKSLGLSFETGLLEPTFQLIGQQIDSSCAGRNKSFDLPLINWLLLFCSQCLDKSTDRGKNSGKKAQDQRWDFLQGEASLRREESAAAAAAKNSFAASHRMMRRKIQKKLMNQQDYAMAGFSGTTGSSAAAKAKIAQLYADIKGTVSGLTRICRRPIPEATDEEEMPEASKDEAALSYLPCLVTRELAVDVARKLVSLLLALGKTTSQIETFTLTCKVLGRLVASLQQTISLRDIMDQQQLTALLRIAAAAQKTPSQLWLNHAVACLLCDYIKRPPLGSDMKSSGNQSAGPSKAETVDEADTVMDWWPSQPLKTSGSQSAAAGSSSQLKHSLFKVNVPSSTSSFCEIDDFIDIFGTVAPNSLETTSGVKKAWPSISSVMKNIMDSKRSVPANQPLAIAEDHHSNGSDLRNELRVDGPWKQKLDILTNSYLTSVVRSLSKPLKNEDQEQVQYLPKNEADVHLEHSFLATSFQELFSSVAGLWNLDIISTLKLWLQLINSMESRKTKTGETQESVPPPVFSRGNIDTILTCLTRIAVMDVGDWCVVIRSLSWMCSLQCIQQQQQQQVVEDIAEQTCAGIVLRDQRLMHLLYYLLSGKGLLPSVLGEKRSVGPTLVATLKDFFAKLRIWFTGGSLSSHLQSSLFSLLLDLCAIPKGPIAQEEGPVDAQACFIEALCKISWGSLDQGQELQFICSIVNAAHEKVRQRGGMVCLDDMKRNSMDPAVCTGFLGFGYSQTRSQSSSISQDSSTPCSSVLDSCLSLAASLLTNNSQLINSVLNHPDLMTEVFETINGCTTASVASTLGTAMFNEEYSPLTTVTTADHILYILLQLARESAFSKPLLERFAEYVSRTFTYDSVTTLSEPFVLYLLHLLGSDDNVNLFLQIGGLEAVCRALVHSPSRPPNPSSRLVSQVLRYLSYVSAASPSSQSRISSGRSLGVPHPSGLISSSASGGVLRKTNLRLDEEDEDGLINFAPLSTVTSSHTSAQSADVLLYPNPPHRRARSPAWSHHFYPSEQFVELIVALPCAILLKEVQLHPHLASLSGCPSSVGIEVSTEGSASFTPVGPVLNATGLTTISLRLKEHRVATSVLLRLYKPRDSSNIGLAQIRILGTLALPTMNSDSLQSGGFSGSVPWLTLLHHCLQLAAKNSQELLQSLCQAASSVEGFVEHCCGLLVAAPCPSSKTGPLTDVAQVACEVLVHLGRFSPRVSKETVQLLLEHSVGPLSCLPTINSLLYKICTCQGNEESVQILLQWLHAVAQSSLQGNNPTLPDSLVNCAASVIWNVSSAGPHVDENFARDIFLWMRTVSHSALKSALDQTLCSIVYRVPSLFHSIFTWLNAADGSQGKAACYPVMSDKQGMLTLARVSQSASGVQVLLQTGVIRYLTQVVLDFCNDLLRSLVSRSTVASATDALGFLTELHESAEARDIHLLSIAPMLLEKLVTASSSCGADDQIHGFQDAVVKFLRQFCWGHRENSSHLAAAMMHCLQSQTQLTGFTRRLLLQLFLEPESIKAYVTLSTTCNSSVASVIHQSRHPRFPPGSHHVLVCINSETTCGELLRIFTDLPTQPPPSNPTARPPALSRRPQVPEERKNNPLMPKDPFQRINDLRSVVMPCYLSSAACVRLPSTVTLSQVMNQQRSVNSPNSDTLEVRVNADQSRGIPDTCFPVDIDPLSTVLDEFSALGGLAILARHLPMLSTSTTTFTIIRDGLDSHRSTHLGTSFPLPSTTQGTTNGVLGISDAVIDSWVKLDGGSDELDEEIEDLLGPPNYTSNNIQSGLPRSKSGAAVQISLLPLHSLMAFNLFLTIPLYAETLLKDRYRARILLRLALGVTDDGTGANILQSSEASQLATLPFKLLQQLLGTYPPRSETGSHLRQNALETGLVELLLACVAVLSQQRNSVTVTVPVLQRNFVITASGTNLSGLGNLQTKGKPTIAESDPVPQPPVGVPGTSQQQQQQQHYWAKGTGFGTGSTAQSWDVEEALQRQKQQEEQAACVLVTLAAYVNPSVDIDTRTDQQDVQLPKDLLETLKTSCLVSALCTYLRNDSVMDMARHVPLYKALLLLLRAVVSSPALVALMLHRIAGSHIYGLLTAMKTCVSNYTDRLSAARGKEISSENSESEEGIADLGRDICSTWNIVNTAIKGGYAGQEGSLTEVGDPSTFAGDVINTSNGLMDARGNVYTTPDQMYCEIMKQIQFDSFEMLVSGESGAADTRFTVAYHFENAVKAAGERSHPSRMKRLAQEAATMMTSLPLSSSSTVFVRCDTDRLDIMKVLITGPSDTPYSNGCFEFDVYFPPDYPQSPMQVHLTTTGRHTVRFNPNLYNDGKVCLSILNTWHGRPEEKWNSNTSSLLQVLVSIQSLILVSEPYFNEPGYERSRGTPSGNQNSRDYDANIRQATVKWAMLEQLKNPSPCFKEAIQTHFWLKRQEVEKQIEEWINEMEGQVSAEPATTRTVAASLVALKRHYAQLKEELGRMNPPKNCPGKMEEKIVSSVVEQPAPEAGGSNKLGNMDVDVTSKDPTFEETEFESLKDIFANLDSGSNAPWPEYLDDSEADMDTFVSQFTI